MPADPDAQVQLALDNMKQTLAAAGMDFRHVVFVNPYLTDKASGQMNAIYAKHFEFGNTPARATIRVASLPGGNTIEFTGVAVADLSKRLAVRPKNMRPSATASPCVFAGDTYYCSAKGPFTPGPDKVQGIYAATVEAQVRQTMRNLLDGLEEAGLTFSNVVATNVYLDDIDDFPRMNRIYAQYFPELFPTRTTVAHASADRSEAGERGHLSGPRADFVGGGEVGRACDGRRERAKRCEPRERSEPAKRPRETCRGVRGAKPLDKEDNARASHGENCS